VLYAEDDGATRRLVQLYLEEAGVLLSTAQDGLEAWETLQAGETDLLLTDNQMPRMTGLELAIRARQAQMALPIVMVSGSFASLAHLESLHLDVAAVLQKPFSLPRLLDAVRTALRAASPRSASSGGQEPGEALAWSSVVPRFDRDNNRWPRLRHGKEIEYEHDR
jgi:CheY-like chemotaxis protein